MKALAKELVDVVADDAVPGRIMVVVEGVTQFADTDAERPMKELFQAINRSDHFLVGDADVSLLSSGFGFIGDFKAGRQGVALKPDAFDGDSVFKTPFPKVAHRAPRAERSSCRTAGSPPCSCRGSPGDRVMGTPPQVVATGRTAD